MQATLSQIRPLIIGKSRDKSVWWLGTALGLLVLWSIASLLQSSLGQTVNTPFEYVAKFLFGAAILVTMILPAVQAYSNDGWLISFLLASIPGLILGLNTWFVTGPPTDATTRLWFGVVYGVVAGVIMGTIGFLAGAGIARRSSND